MDKNSTTFITTQPKSGRMIQELQSPSSMTLARVRQFARSYAYFQKANQLGGIILN